ncbi:response regulator transcription factor [Sorangium sp. So ce233]|uniref:helix-turn-helix transcriptional regulator n=1 Tax=Sorangium sp. So ce233 TaxID=3133290 RepID=UPI003F5D614C
MGSSDSLDFEQLRRALRLANELRDLPRGSELQRQHALSGLCAMVGARIGLWVELRGVASGRVVLGDASGVGWEDARQREGFMHYVGSAQRRSEDPSLPRFAQVPAAPVVTVMRRQLLQDSEWYGSDHVQEFRRGGNVDDFIYTAFRTGPDTSLAIALHRSWGDRQYTEQERRLVEVFHEECSFLHRPPEVPAALLAGLAPRLRETLRGLSRGLSEKEIAAELRISPHTVHDYVKALHRHFGVQSRGELLALCLGQGPSGAAL